MIEIRPMTLRECRRGLLRRFERHAVDTHIWKNGALVEEVFEMDWDKAKCRGVVKALRENIRKGSVVAAAWDGRRLAGFCIVASEPLGGCGQYLNLLCLQASKPYRGCGLGKQLFVHACEQARARGAQKLYVSSSPSNNTVSFYRHMGCVPATEHIQWLVEAEPDDYHMECVL